MRLKQHYDAGSQIWYKISIGGYIQLRWRSGSRLVATIEMLSASPSSYMLPPKLKVSNNAILVLAMSVMRHWLETARNRYAYEDIDAYLIEMWRRGLKAMGVKSGWSMDEVALAGGTLGRSKAMKKLKRERAGGKLCS